MTFGIDQYLTLNTKLNSYFFGGAFADQPVYLDFEGKVIDVLSEAFKKDPEEIEKYIGKIVGETLRPDAKHIYQEHLSRLKDWRTGTYFDEGPPFTALLLSFSMAAEHMRSGSNISPINYYKRLSEVYGGETIAPAELLSDNRNDTEKFWSALNEWLEDYDFTLGMPTAQSLGPKTYIGYALSQSLVRDTDRENLQKMMEQGKLDQYGEISPDEMRVYLGEWVAKKQLNSWLINLWGAEQEGIRSRIISAAIGVLKSEDFKGKSDSSGNKIKILRWALEYRPRPRRKVRLRLMHGDKSVVEHEKLHIHKDCSDTVRAYLLNKDDFRFRAETGTGRFILDGLDDGIGFFLSDRLSLGSEGGVGFENKAKPIIVFKKNETSGRDELPKTLLHEKHSLVVQDNFFEKVKCYLDEYARSGYESFEGNGKNGLPEGWWFFENVQIVRVHSANEDLDLTNLIPSNEGDTMVLEGGLSLMAREARTWHINFPPEILVSSEKQIEKLTIKKEDGSNASKNDVSTINEYDPRCLKNLVESGDIDSGVYSIAAAPKSKRLQGDFRLRSADNPRKLKESEASESVCLPLAGDDAGVMTSRHHSGESLPEVALMSGCCVEGIVPSSFIPEEFSSAPVQFNGQREDEFESNLAPARDVGGACFDYHTFECEPQVGKEKPSRIMTCLGCGIVKIEKKPNGRKKRQMVVSRPESATYQIKKSLGGAIDIMSIYDAICWLRKGKWKDLERLSNFASEEALQVMKFVSDLVDSGSIDAHYDVDFNRPKLWSTTPTVLMENFGGSEVFLTGYANGSMLSSLESVMDKNFVRRDYVPDNFALGSFSWKLNGCSLADLSEMVSGIRNSLEQPLLVRANTAMSILRGLMSIKNILPTLEIQSVPKKPDLKVFNLLENRWTTGDVKPGAAHQLFQFSRSYFYTTSDGESHFGPYELIKLLAARRHESRLCEHDPEYKKLIFKVGCAAPGLYRRALFAVNGRLPYYDKNLNGEVYEQVPEEFASLLIYKLYG
ncbi:MAG: hypothetical protein P8N92_00765 [Burkholderiales bacterium]|nr:hypothetical protein [Burkholderiales bacterium]